MRMLPICLVAALPLAACATPSERWVENGMPRGSLGVAAIDRGDLGRAQQLLESSVLDSDDPARLINLGYVYHRQGRRGDAIAAWQSALEAPRHQWVQTMSGRDIRTDELARELLRQGRVTITSR